MPHYFNLLLHAHLPYVYHPEESSFLEENWLFEAISETYIPLLQMLERLDRDKVSVHLSISLSSTLLAMLDHPQLQERYLDYLKNQIALCEDLLKHWKCPKAEQIVLRNYLNFYQKNLSLFQVHYGRQLIPSFRNFRDKDMLELLCTAATHAFLPNFRQYPRMVCQQIRLAMATFEKYFGKQTHQGFWLPECAYYDGLDQILVDEGLHYTYIALHGLLGSDALPQNGSFSPVKSPAGLILFPYERSSSAIVWDQKIGYPSTGIYRDFYCDAGYKADIAILEPHLPRGLRYHTGVKLWSIEKCGVQRVAYRAEAAQAQAAEHADHFLTHVKSQNHKASQLMSRPPLLNAAYDAELFGHWWFEGPHFLEQLFRCEQRASLQFTTPSKYLLQQEHFQVLAPCFSSWGQDGYAQVWLDQQNDWIYPQLFQLYENIEIFLGQANKPSSHEYSLCQQQALKQLIREFTLACSSDWAFMMKSDTAKDYAITRTNTHIQNSFDILQGLTQKKFDLKKIRGLRYKSRIFLGLPIKDFLL